MLTLNICFFSDAKKNGKQRHKIGVLENLQTWLYHIRCVSLNQSLLYLCKEALRCIFAYCNVPHSARVSGLSGGSL